MVGPKLVCDDGLRTAVAFNSSAQKPQCSLAISFLGDEDFKDFALVIDRPPEVMGFAVDPHENFVQMPAPLDMGAH